MQLCLDADEHTLKSRFIYDDTLLKLVGWRLRWKIFLCVCLKLLSRDIDVFTSRLCPSVGGNRLEDQSWPVTGQHHFLQDGQSWPRSVVTTTFPRPSGCCHQNPRLSALEEQRLILREKYKISEDPSCLTEQIGRQILMLNYVHTVGYNFIVQTNQEV